MPILSFSKWGSKYVDCKLDEYSRNPLRPTRQLLCQIYSCIDLTSLSNDDSADSIASLVEGVNRHAVSNGDIQQDGNSQGPEYYIPNVAGICVYPKFVAAARKCLKAPGVDIVSVAGGFPHAQTFREIKAREVELAAMCGADEIDVVITAGDIISGHADCAREDLLAMRQACHGLKMKVILETGVYECDSQIYDAAMLAMQAGADFIKTSTGKCQPTATPRAAVVMALAAKDYEQATGKKIGIKPAGGIRSVQDAVQYCQIVEDILGQGRACKDYFRIGATSLAGNVLSALQSID